MDRDLVERIHHCVKELGLDHKLSELAELLLYETEKHPPLDSAFLYSNTQDNQASVFGGAAELKQKRLAHSYLLIGSDDDSTGFQGYTRWSTALEAVVGRGNIRPVPLLPMKKNGVINVNNLSESESLVDYAAKQGIQALYVVAWNVQQLRAVMTAVSVVLKEGSQLSIFSHSGTKLPWDSVVHHSQGNEVGTRAEFVSRELVMKIAKYQAEGDILPARDIIQYMERRALPPQPPQQLNSGGLAHQS
ncbi:hypothetical protein HYU16_04280 [Candidatus Woesearchaeota archaeon]|nr:hypothetical protein [Candidatus Woesearchaeota archaeon]